MSQTANTTTTTNSTNSTNSSSDEGCYTVRTDECISCAACASIAPAIFQMEPEAGTRSLKPRILRQPATPEEISQIEEAAAACPVQAIFRA
jgi:ferredoxin